KKFSAAAMATPAGLATGLSMSNIPIDPRANFPSRAIVEKKMLHLPDWSLIDLPEGERNVRDAYAVNSALYLPLLRDDECIGVLALTSGRANTFGAKDIVLAESFRDQAMIAIENVRL